MGLGDYEWRFGFGLAVKAGQTGMSSSNLVPNIPVIDGLGLKV